MEKRLDGKTILITGGTGFIGSNIVKKLRENENVSLIVVSRSKRIKEAPNLEYIKCNLLDEKSIATIQSKIRDVDYVLHMAAMIPKSSSQDELEENVKQNLLATLNLLKYLPANIKGFVYSSTIDVYGEPIYNPIDETHQTNPLTYYGASKLATEKYSSIFLNRRQIPLTILRYSQVYGPGEPKIKAIPVFIDMVIKGEYPILYGDGSDTRDYVYVDDVVNATILALSKNLNGVFNIGCGKGYSVKEVLDMIIDISGKEIKPIYKPIIKKPFSSIFDITLAKEKLDYLPSATIKEGLKKQIEFTQGERNG
jgi:UDP-glucose 4-epimerase